MAEIRRLNIDVGGSVGSLQSILKEFELKVKLFRIILGGKGFEFDGYRNYTPSDDSQIIDWKASKRANQLLVRKYIEEQNLKIIFLIDVGDNMVFGSTEKLKCEYSAEIVLAMSNLIMGLGNKIGYVFFSDKIKNYVPPSRGDRHFGQLIDEISNASYYGGPSNLNLALDFAEKNFGKNINSVILVSDFINFHKSARERLSPFSTRFETISLMVRDPLDLTLPDVSGEVLIEDPLTGERILINPKLARNVYERHAKEQEVFVKETFRDFGIDLVEITTDKDFAPILATFLKERTKGFLRKGGTF